MAHWKTHSSLYIRCNWISLSFTVETLWAEIRRSRCFSKGGHFECRYQREGGVAHQPLLVWENRSDCRIVWYQNIRSPSFSFVIMHASDRLTDIYEDRQTELRQQYALHYMQSHGKNGNGVSHSIPVDQRIWRSAVSSSSGVGSCRAENDYIAF